MHEGPCGISYRVNARDPGLQEGMVLSDEPGYYEDGAFGIRIETLLRVVPAATKFQVPDTPVPCILLYYRILCHRCLQEKSRTQFLTFTPVTVVPVQVSPGFTWLIVFT